MFEEARLCHAWLGFIGQRMLSGKRRRRSRRRRAGWRRRGHDCAGRAPALLRRCISTGQTTRPGGVRSRLRRRSVERGSMGRALSTASFPALDGDRAGSRSTASTSIGRSCWAGRSVVRMRAGRSVVRIETGAVSTRASFRRRAGVAAVSRSPEATSTGQAVGRSGGRTWTAPASIASSSPASPSRALPRPRSGAARAASPWPGSTSTG